MALHIKKVVEGKDLSAPEAEGAMNDIMSGNATPAQISAYLTALRIKGETVEEIGASAKVMRKFASSIKPQVNGTIVDTCGTGGDNSGSFNISTTSALISAGSGVLIAKHGNRSFTSKSGSADLLEALGVRIDLTPEQVEKCMEEIGICFMFAPTHHKAMKYAVPVRKEIGIRTIFNILGPLSSPAGAKAQVMGIFDPELTETLAKALGKLGVERAFVVHGSGLDEFSTTGETRVSELKDGKVETYTVKPEDFNLKRATKDQLKGGDAKKNADITLGILKGKKGPARDIAVLNAAAAIVVSGKAGDMKEGIKMAEESIDSGKALAKLEELKRYTNDCN